MFSPEASVHSLRGSSSRNPRRRQRESDSDGLQQPSQRKRTRLTPETFNPSTNHKVNGNGSVLTNGHAGHGEVPVREKKTHPKRITKGDGSIYLTKNANYSVKKLPTIPAQLDSGVPFRAFVLPSIGRALALTSQTALVWDYTTAFAPNKVHSVSLPFGAKEADPLPIGALVKSGPSGDVGLVVVAPTSGKITFWDNVDSAEARSQFSQRDQGVNGSVGKIFSSETVVEIVDVEHAGFILVFSSGRLAQLTLRDAQGRPNVNVTFLNHGSGGGFFGLKGLFGGGIRKAIAAVRARPSESKGRMEIISATREGVFEFWDLSWSGQHIFKKQYDMQADILAELEAAQTSAVSGQNDATILDFSILPRRESAGSEISVLGGRGDVNLLVLAAFSGPQGLSYALVEVDFLGDGHAIRRVIPLSCYEHTNTSKDPLTASLLVPQPGHSALVQFKDAVIVSSLNEPEESPDAQLMSDVGTSTLPFQDAIYLRKDSRIQIVGSGSEILTRKDRVSSCLFFIRGCGVVQISLLPPTNNEGDIERQRVTARSKLEQATFFSTLPGNILDFSIKSRWNFDKEEVEGAAESISHDILISSSEFVEKISSSMDEQITKRYNVLRTLIKHLRSDYPPMSFETTWKLLSDAEKVAAGLELWKRYDQRIQRQVKNPEAFEGQEPLFPQMVEYLHERYKTEPRPDLGELDPVRLYFTRDLDNLEKLVPWAFNMIAQLYRSGHKEHSSLLQLVSEADDIVLSTLDTAFTFRQKNAELYGVDPKHLENGVLKPDHGYENLREIWTSTHNIVHTTKQLVDMARRLACRYDSTDFERIAAEIATQNAGLVKLCCQIYTERSRWYLERPDSKSQNAGRQLLQEFEDNIRGEQILGLGTIGQFALGSELAERYHDMPTLVALVRDEVSFTENAKVNSTSHADIVAAQLKLKGLNERILRYFKEYGEDWAEAWYTAQIRDGKSSDIFNKACLDQPALTKYLRKDVSRAKLRWINEVRGEKNYHGAAEALQAAAHHQETNNWSKQTELSIAKLALMCKDNKDTPSDTKLDQKIKNDSEVARIQETLWEHVYPTAENALDDESALDLVMEAFGQKHVREKPALEQLLRQSFEKLLQHEVLEPELLIDMLTLMEERPSDEEHDGIYTMEYWLALRVLDLIWESLSQEARGRTLGLIWKRCYIRDSWDTINDTAGESDEQIQENLGATTLAFTLMHLTKAKNTPEELQNFVILRPSDVLGAGCSKDEHRGRFPEDLIKAFISDNLEDDNVLQDAIQHSNLDAWVDTCQKVVESSLRQQLREQVNRVQDAPGDAEDRRVSRHMVLVDDDEASGASDTDVPSAFDGDDEESVVNQDQDEYEDEDAEDDGHDVGDEETEEDEGVEMED